MSGAGAFVDKVVLVTGATGGIWRATALAFAREGARVVVTGRRDRDGEETVRQQQMLDCLEDYYSGPRQGRDRGPGAAAGAAAPIGRGLYQLQYSRCETPGTAA